VLFGRHPHHQPTTDHAESVQLVMRVTIEW
jgi:hypothetical protein